MNNQEVRITNCDLQRVYLLSLRHRKVRVPGHELAQLIREVARARGLSLYEEEPEDEADIWASILSTLERFTGKRKAEEQAVK